MLKYRSNLPPLELLKGEWNFTYYFAVLFQDEATLEGIVSPRAYSLGHDSSELAQLSEQNERECFEKAVLTFGWNRVKMPFHALSPSSIKHHLPSGIKSVLARTTRLRSSPYSLKCVKLLDRYEYGLETQGNS